MIEDWMLNPMTAEKEMNWRTYEREAASDMRNANAVKLPSSMTEDVSHGRGQKDTESESKGNAESQATTPPLSSTISSHCDSNSSLGVLSTPPHLQLYLQDSDDLASKRLLIEESDAELIDQAARPADDEDDFDKGTRAAINRAPITGRGLPIIIHDVEEPFEPSEITDITDLGNWLYDLKRQGRRVTSAPISYGDPNEALQDRLLRALQEAPGHAEKKGFFPMDQMANLIHEDCVIAQLRSDFSHLLDDKTIRKYAQEICGVPSVENDGERPAQFKKIFVTLVLSEKTPTIPKFLAEDVTDDDLPLIKVPRPGMPASIFDLGRRRTPDLPLECFKTWSSSAIRRFEEWQWSSLAPFFARSERKHVKHYILQDQVILPFRREAVALDRLEFEGGFSRVFQVYIHPEHHDFHDPSVRDRCFAVKCLLSSDREAFKNEVEMLKKFSADSHAHLVSLLATYEQFGRFYLVFPWADADLQDYWEKIKPTPLVDLETILWMAQQCEGIAAGLCKVHRYESNKKLHPNSALEGDVSAEQYLTPTASHALAQTTIKLFGRHGDIKPANVLWFRDPDNSESQGTLKISDFGLAEFSAAHSRSYKAKSKIATTVNYRPPECDLKDGMIGLSYDIWTLGCLYLEFITWLLGGWNLVQEFTKRRMSLDRALHMLADTFFETDAKYEEAWIKPAVTDFIFELHSHHLCTEFLHEFLELIRLDMIVVKPKHKGRITCKELHQRLLDMVQRCRHEADYASKPGPLSRIDLERRYGAAGVRANNVNCTSAEKEELWGR